MSRRFAILLTSLAGLILLGVLTLSPDTGDDGSPAALGPVFPALANTVNAVDAIALSDLEARIDLVRKDGAWQFKTLPGIPVAQGKVREFLLDLSQSSLVEAKTGNPAFHSALGLGAAGTRIDLAKAGSLVLGKESAPGGLFVRRGDEDQTYLAKDITTPQITLKAWADLTLPVVRKELVTKVDVDDGTAPYSVSVTDGNQVLDGLQGDEELAYEGVLDTVVAGAVFLDYQDIKSATEFDWAGASRTTFHGTRKSDTMVYEIIETDAVLWLRASPAGVFAQNSDIVWQDWAFQISDYRKQTLLKPRSELLMEKEPAP